MIWLVGLVGLEMDHERFSFDYLPTFRAKNSILIHLNNQSRRVVNLYPGIIQSIVYLNM